MKLAAAFAIFGLGVGTASVAFGQSDHAVDLPTSSYANTTTGLGTNSKTNPASAPSATPGDESKTDENDDALYRGRTTESEVPMLRDEGRLHFKTHGKEKIQQVDSLKNLQSSGSDPKFQGSLLNSSVASIEDLKEKTTTAHDEASDVDQRFKPKQLTFTPEKDGQPQKAGSDSTPSPTPSATASPQKKDSNKTNP
jgi:hypothetical protein